MAVYPDDLWGSMYSLIRRGFGTTGSLLPLPVLLDELEGWLIDSRPGSLKQARSSLLQDLEMSVEVLGEGLRQHLEPGLGRLLASARATLTPPQTTPERRASACEAIVAVRTALQDGSAPIQAWDDVTAGIGPSMDLDDISPRVEVLHALRELAGWAKEPQTVRLNGILVDDANDVASAQIYLGRRERPERWYDARARAGLSCEERLSLCRDFVGIAAKRGRCVVWLAYERARMATPVLVVENLTFYRSSDLVQRLRLDPSSGELDEIGELDHLPEPPEGEDMAYLRVQFDDHLPIHARRDAQQLADAITGDLTSFTVGMVWKPRGWTLLSVDGRRGGASHFMTPSEIADLERGFDHARALERLQSDVTRVVSALNHRLPFDRRLADALRANASAKTADPRNKLLLLSRATEAAAAVAGFKDVDAIAGAVEEAWAGATLSSELHHAALLSVGRDGTFGSPELKELDKALFASSADDSWSYVLSFSKVAENGDALIASATDSVEEANNRTLVHTLTDPTTYLSRHRRFLRHGRALGARCKRARDAVTHGNPLDDRVLDSVLGFAEYKADFALHLALEVLASTRTGTEAREATLVPGRSVLQSIKMGARPIDAFH